MEYKDVILSWCTPLLHFTTRGCLISSDLKYGDISHCSYFIKIVLSFVLINN